MKKLKRIIFILIAAVVALVIVVVVGRNLLIRLSVPTAVRSATGFDASVGGIDVGLFSSHVQIRNLMVKNPDDFPEKRMLNAPEIYVEYKLGSMLGSRREFPHMKLQVQEVVVVKLASGESNLARMQKAVAGEESKEESSGPTSENHIGKLDLRIGKVILVDYTKAKDGKPSTREYVLNFQNSYENISDKDTTRLVMLVALQSAGLKLGDLNLGALQKQLGDIGGVGKQLTSSLTNTSEELFKGLGGLFQSGTNKPKSK